MVLGNIFKKNGEDIELFWSLVIGKTWVHAGIWRVVGEATEIVAEGASASWEEDNIESLLTAADSSLSSAAANISEEAVEPSKVVFGLMSSWVEEGSIKKERLGILKKLSDELELSPAGFVVLPEAIIHFVKAREGAPLNVILVGLSDDSAEINLVQSGKILGTTEVSRSISLGADTAEGLARLPSIAQYPSRILLYNHKISNLDDARQNLIDTEWGDLKVHFLHTPKVEILPQDVGVTAVSLAGGAEVGHAKTVVTADEDEFNDEEQTEIPAGVEEKELEEVSAEELGFLEGVDTIHKTLGIENKSAKEKEEQSKPETIQVDKREIEEVVEKESPVPHVPAKHKTSIFSRLAGLGNISLPRPSMKKRGKGVFLLTVIAFILLIAGSLI